MTPRLAGVVALAFPAVAVAAVGIIRPPAFGRAYSASRAWLGTPSDTYRNEPLA